MPFCPKCRTQYREGFTLCSDCKIPLVDQLIDDYEIEGLEGLNNPEAPNNEVEDNTPDAAAEGEGRVVRETVEIKLWDETPGSKADINIENLNYDMFEKDKEAKDAPKQQIDAQEMEHINKYIKKEMARRSRPSKEYVSNDEKSKELKSTGIMLIVVGVLSCTFIVLFVTGVLPFKFRGGFSWVIYGLLFAFFASFIYFGINSLLKYRDIMKYVRMEKEENSEFEEWFKKNITPATVDAGLPLTDEDQSNYFMRFERIKYMISKEFPDLNDDYIEMYIDKTYGDMFE